MHAAAQINMEDSGWSAIIDRQVNGRWGFYLLDDGIKLGGGEDFESLDLALKAAGRALDKKASK